MFLIDLGRESTNSVELVFASSHTPSMDKSKNKRVYTDQSTHNFLSTESQSNC